MTTIEVPLAVALALADAAHGFVNANRDRLPLEQRQAIEQAVAAVDAKARFVHEPDHLDSAEPEGKFSVMSPTEIAQQLDCTPQHVLRRCRDLLGPRGLARRLGHSWAISPDALELLR